jgi:hypothetical protein
MARGLLSRLSSVGLILLMAGGGGSLPVLDGLLFHRGERVAAALRPHFEATGSCHADGCTIRSTAQQARLVPPAEPVGRMIAVPESPSTERIPLVLVSKVLAGQQLSRAPPFFG